MIDHDKKIIFIPNMKCASSSIVDALFDQEQTKLHWTARWFKEKYDDYWDEYFKFAFVRNIWDLLVSWYSYMSSRYKKYSFDHFIKNMDDYTPIQHWKFKGLYDRITDEKGNVIVDYIGKIENIQNDFDFICNKIGVPSKTLKKVNTTNHNYYCTYYNRETVNIVKKKFRDDIVHFGYAF